ncbi:MAG: TetR/AcrR family transcriptional regulator [Azoarcus sp.]|jgi:AcrR family transcriptional regulator|nr:TetR/AcrR family transcriptional regulator [Azoarcus sp.]
MNDKRQIILNTALTLFRAHGYRAIGIDRILAESGVAKMTMYKYFPSKDALIHAVLEERDRDFRQSLEVFVDAFAAPDEKLRAIFLWHERWFKSDDFNGCMFINAAAEFPDPAHPARQAVIEHKSRIQAFATSLLRTWPTGEETSKQLAAQFSMLLDGAIVSAQMTGDTTAARLAWQSATTLLHAAGLVIETNVSFDE